METNKVKTIGIAITGSFCTHSKVLAEIEKLTKKYRVIPIISEASASTDTRFGSHRDLVSKLIEITGEKPITTIVEAEPIGPKNMLDVLIVAPCTGNTLAKLACAVTDGVVMMAAKSHMRNNKPVVIAVSSNDALGQNAANLGRLIASNNFYFVPFGQDDPIKKPKSLVADFTLIDSTIAAALEGRQLQPILLKN